MGLLGPQQKALLQTGRDVGRAAWRAAQAADAVALKASRPARVQFRRFLSPAHAVAAMAELMALRAAAFESCSEQDLLIAGFSADDVARYGGRAQVMAAALTRDRIAA